jgi:uncharacterized protein YdaU (DUF1376 family)
MSKDNRSPLWMPLYWGDYLRDTMHLTTLEHGAYLLLIGHYWTTTAPLPDDNSTLATIARLDPKTWKQMRPKLEALFHIAGGQWRHRRIDAELEKAISIIDVRSKAAKKRWANHSKSNASAYANALQKDLQNGVQNGAGAYDNHNHNHNLASKKELSKSSTLRARDGGVDF